MQSAATFRFQDLSLNSSPFVIETGMQVDMDPMLVRARILKAPTLAYGGGQLVRCSQNFHVSIRAKDRIGSSGGRVEYCWTVTL